jgi:four helix bundle protein
MAHTLKIGTTMRNGDLKQRTKKFALDIIKLVEALPRSRTADVLGRQLLRSGTSVAANYRAATRAKSPADFVCKMSIVEEEADESALWLELLTDAQTVAPDKAAPSLREAGELTAIAVASINTARRNSEVPRSALRAPRSAF